MSENEETLVWRLTPYEFAKTQAKIERLNERAIKSGWTGRLEVTGKEVTVTERGPSGLPVTRQFVDTTVTGEPPKYGGWVFLAKLEWDEESGLIVSNAPGTPTVDRSKLHEGVCDHCHINRYRKETYLVSNDQGETMQVGSTCLKDFLGWDTRPVWVSPPTSDDLFEEGGWGHSEPSYSTETVLAAAWACVQQFGFVPSNGFGSATKYTVENVLHPRTERARKLASEIGPFVDEAIGQAKVIREWVLSDAFNGDTDYVINLKNIARGDFVTTKRFGILVSAPQAWARAQERDLVRRREQAELLNEWNGKPGDKLELTVTLKSERDIPGDWGTTTLYTFEGDDHRVYKWFSSRVIWTDELPTEPIKIKGTVKKHDEYNGTKSTVLTRVKVL